MKNDMKKISLVEETREALKDLRETQEVSLEYTEEDAKVLGEYLNMTEEEIDAMVESIDESFDPSFAEVVEVFGESEFFKDMVSESEETLLEVEKGQMSKRGLAASLFGGPAGVALYVLYKKVKRDAEAARTKCGNETGPERGQCMMKVRIKEIEAKKAAIKRAAGKEKDPKKKKTVVKTAKKELAKLDKRLKDIKKRAGALV